MRRRGVLEEQLRQRVRQDLENRGSGANKWLAGAIGEREKWVSDYIKKDSKVSLNLDTTVKIAEVLNIRLDQLTRLGKETPPDPPGLWAIRDVWGTLEPDDQEDVRSHAEKLASLRAATRGREAGAPPESPEKDELRPRRFRQG